MGSDCRKLLFGLQQSSQTKGVVWLRNIKDPEQNGYLVGDLAAVTPDSLSRALKAEQRNMATMPKGESRHLTSMQVGFFPLSGLSLRIIQDVWPEIDDIRDALLADKGLLECQCFFITYMH